MDIKKFNLSTLDPDLVMDQFLPYYQSRKAPLLNVFPNFPIVSMMVKPWAIQSNRFWIVTQDIPESIFKKLEAMNMVPFYGYNYTFQNMEYMYYKQYVYNYAYA